MQERAHKLPKVRLASGSCSRMQLNPPHATSPNTSRRFALGASNICLVDENTTCSVPTLQGCGGLELHGFKTTVMHDMSLPPPRPSPPRSAPPPPPPPPSHSCRLDRSLHRLTLVAVPSLFALFFILFPTLFFHVFSDMEGARARRDIDQGAMESLIADATRSLQQQDPPP